MKISIFFVCQFLGSDTRLQNFLSRQDRNFGVRIRNTIFIKDIKSFLFVLWNILKQKCILLLLIPKLSMFLLGSNHFSFILPTSTTNTQSSMVMLVSAMFVDITIFRTP